MTYTVKLVRQSMNKTQEEMAKLMGISRDTYRKIELHPETATIPQAKKFCDDRDECRSAKFFCPVTLL